MAFYETDCEAIWLHIRRHEKEIAFKRRWLLGLPTFLSEQKQLECPEVSKNRYLPESLLREDDVFYDTVKLRVEEAFGARNVERRHHIIQDNMQILNASKLKRVLLSSLDDLSNKGLYVLATTLIGDSKKFEKTRSKMKKIIKEFLPKVVRGQNNDLHQVKFFKEVSQLLNDPQNCRQNSFISLCSRSWSYRAAATQVLDMLGELPTESLFAMRRKLKGIRGVPELKRHRHGWSRDRLISFLTGNSEEMLSELDEGDELQVPLAKAMAVADLSLKLAPGCHNSSIMEFYKFSSQTKTLHDEILKAIWLVQKKFTLRKLKKVQVLLDPDAKIPSRSLRTAIRKMLIEYLFECGDMDTIPKSLIEALAVINGSSQNVPHKCYAKDEIEKEVEYILCLSAQMRQIYQGLLPYHDFGQEFTDAYMEDLEDSDEGGDDGDVDDDGNSFMREDSCVHAIDSKYPVECTGESLSLNPQTTSLLRESGLSPLCSPRKSLSADCVERLKAGHFTSMEALHNFSSPFQGSTLQNSPQSMSNRLADNTEDDRSIKNSEDKSIADSACMMDLGSFSLSYGLPPVINGQERIVQNQYLMSQEICDESSVIAYNIIGLMLEEFAKIERLNLDWNDNLYLNGHCSLQEDSLVSEDDHAVSGDNMESVIIQVCEKFIPSLPKSGIEKLKNLMGI